MDIFQKLQKIETLIKNQIVLTKEFLTLEETAEYLNLSKSALYKATSRKEIPFYNPGGKKIYFKRIELDAWITQGKSVSDVEIEEEMTLYLTRNTKSKL